MIYQVSRPASILKTTVRLPASKSISNRLLIINALAGSSELPENLSESDDTRVMLEALSSDIETKDVGHAGTSMRFLAAYFSCRPGKVVLTGSDRMKERPIGPLVDALRSLGAEINYAGKDGFPPLEIHGSKMDGGEITIDGSISSQFISALLMIAPTMKKGLVLHVKGDLVSASYVKMTLELMAENGAQYRWDTGTISVFPGTYAVGDYRVESDWSGASYWYVMALLEEHARIRLSFLKNDSLQGDSALVNIFHGLGLVSEFRRGQLDLTRLARIHPGIFSYDFTNSPDIVQSMAVALCMAGIPFRFNGTQTLRIKETDRILALQNELKKLGFVLETDRKGSFLSWNKQYCEPDPDPVIETYHDHRMAMAFAPAALLLGHIRIKDPMVVTKSYPQFWEHLEKAGFRVNPI